MRRYIQATTKFSVVGKKLTFTSFAANATFRYSIGDTSSDTWMKLYGSVEMALPCTRGMVGQGKVGRCRLTVSKSVLKLESACVVSALETRK